MNGNIKNANRQGYTLLEIIVVLALLGIFLSISVPSISVIGNFKEREEIKAFRRDIISTKNKAIMEGLIYKFTIDDINNDYNISLNSDTVKRVELEYWEIVSTNFENTVYFLATGSPDRGGTIRLRNKRGKITELRIVPVTGKLNVYENL